MEWIDDDKVVVLIGKRETGKSYLTRDLLAHHKDIPIGTVISGTEGANAFYTKFVPSLFIHEDYTPDLIKNVIKRQKNVIDKMQRPGGNAIDPRAFLILDDCLYDSTWIKDKNMRRIFMNGRHYKLLFVLTMQFALGVPPHLRTNVDYVFILRENIVSNRKRLYEHYCGMFPTFDSFCQVMDSCTENFECLVIHNNAKSNKLEDQVFWYKANQHEEFRMGKPEFWKHHTQHYNPNHEDSDEELAGSGKKNKSKVIVKKSN
jgi:hypothetical protein